MARVRTSSDSPAGGEPPSSVRIPLSVVEDPTRADLRAMTPEEHATWRELRRIFFRAEYCHPEFDPRRVLGVGERQREAWRERRRRWLAGLFANDPRVDTDS